MNGLKGWPNGVGVLFCMMVMMLLLLLLLLLFVHMFSYVDVVRVVVVVTITITIIIVIAAVAVAVIVVCLVNERVSECIFYLFNRFFICHLFLYFIILIFCCFRRRRSSFGMFFISLARAIACGRRSGFADFLWLLLAL